MTHSDDQRFKELTDRLVAMSPEPPPFPEETIVISQGNNQRRSPMLVFAGAAAVVLLAIGIPFILLNNDGPPVATPETSTTTTSTTTVPDSSTSSTEPSTPIAEFGSVVYLTQSPENSFLGNPALVAFETFVNAPAGADDAAIIKASLELLTNPDFVVPDGFTNSVPAGLEVVEVRRAEGADNAIIIEMNDKFLEGAGGLLGDFTMLNQLIYTAMRGDINEVQFLVNNQQVTEFGSDGLDLSPSVNAETFRGEGTAPNIALINLTSPILPNQDGNVVVQGISNTFEASMALLVLDDQGGIVHEEFTTATCGSGCWGDYLFVLDSALFETGTAVQLLEYSAKDGEPSNVVTIPYNEGAPWRLLP